MTADQVVFWVFGPISIASAVAMLLQRNAVHSALFLIVNFFCLSVFYLVLGAEFLFAVQIIVYAGAIMVLFLFVIMLLGVDRQEPLRERLRWQRPLGLALGAAVAIEVFLAVRAGVGLSAEFPGGFVRANRGGNARALARVLFRDYFLPFEVTSVLLIVAAIAVTVLAQRRSRARTEAERAAEGDRPGASEDTAEVPV